MKTLFIILSGLLLTSYYSYKQAGNQFKIFEKNKNYKITQGNKIKEIKVLEVNKDSIKVKYFDYNSDIQIKKHTEKISINDIQSVKIQKFSLLKTSGLTVATLFAVGYIYYNCCFELNLR